MNIRVNAAEQDKKNQKDNSDEDFYGNFGSNSGNMRDFLHVHTDNDVSGGRILSGIPVAGLRNRRHCYGFQQKKLVEGKGWIWVLVLGILGVLMGLYSLVHPLILAFTFGLLVGMYFIESGINMIVMATSGTSEG